MKIFALISAPILLYCFINIVVPVPWFSFRAQEGLSVYSVPMLKSEFYANQSIFMTEEGDLGHHSRYAVPKQVHWQTDQYGYRNLSRDHSKTEIMVIGDSFAGGFALDQKDMLGSRLEELLGKPTFTLARGNINDFIRRFHFINPKYVVLESVDIIIKDLPEILEYNLSSSSDRIKKSYVDFLYSSPLLSAFIAVDKILKNAPLRFVQGRTNDFFNRLYHHKETSIETIVGIDQKTLFTEGDVVKTRDHKFPEVDSVVRLLEKYQLYLNQRGIDFIFVPLPNKSLVYNELLPEEYRYKTQPTFLAELIQSCREKNIKVIETLEVFTEAKSKGLLFHYDDTHWNTLGVNIVADKIAGSIKSQTPLSSTLEPVHHL